MVHVRCFSVSIIHWTLTWNTGSLMCVCDLFACVYTQGLVQCLIWMTFMGYSICTEFSPQGNLPTVSTQSLAQNGHPSIWWPCLVMLAPAFESEGSHYARPTHPVKDHVQVVTCTATLFRLSRVLWRCASCPIMFYSACVMLARHVVLHCRPNVCDVVMMKLQFLLCPR